MAARPARFDARLPPIPGLVCGPYPQRLDAPGAASHPAAALVEALRGLLAGARQGLGARAERRRARQRLAEARAEQRGWLACDAATHAARLRSLRARLARDGWGGAWRAEALGCVAAAGRRALGRDPFDTQLHAAGVLLDDRFAEMATGEGKTYAAALAAAVAALAGVPVHLLTANDYLAQRDAQQLEPLFAALGLRVGTVLASSSPEERRAAYACELTYCTAREVAFDYLRDGLGSATPAPRGTLLRGLCMAILDEADSLLIDEAELPLVLSEACDDAQQRAACFQALALARGLEAGRDLRLDPATGRLDWLDAGVQRLESLSRGLDGGPWRNRRHRQDLVGAAFEALHRLERDRDYVVREGKVELLDAVTGRAAPGRVWARGLQTLVELKEGCAPSAATAVCARIGYQRFFARYLRLCGMSGTLAECRAEIRASTGREVLAIELRLPSRRHVLGERLFLDAAGRDAAVVCRVAALQAAGRPVLVGTDSLAASQALSARLAAAGIAHRVLDAHHDRSEAEIVAEAGRRGAVTVATRMAGRGTDVLLGPGVAALGGLHVLNCQDNASRRLDRQLIGRAARQGDPGSAETWRTLDAPRWRALSRVLRRGRQPDADGAVRLPPRLLRCAARWLQRADETRRARQRRRLLEQDREWERQLGFSKAR